MDGADFMVQARAANAEARTWVSVQTHSDLKPKVKS
jgi:hypothetical protein